MKTALSLSLLAGTLVPALAQAQSITPTQTTIRLYEQPRGNVLGAEKRAYTYYFNTLRTRYIGVEVTLDYPAAAETFQLTISCQMTRPDGRVIDGIWKIGVAIRAGSTRGVGANTMFGAGKAGWPTGLYKVTCAATRPLGESAFQMSPGPSLLGDFEFRLADVKFFATGARLVPQAEREYQDRFFSKETARIGIELTFVHPAGKGDSEVPIDCYILPSVSRILGDMHIGYAFQPAATSGSVVLELGWDQPGQWPKGDYLAVCQIHGRPILLERFMVW